MTTPNAGAARAMAAVGVRAATAVMGFGLLGHLRNILAASAVSAEIWSDAVAILPAPCDYVARGLAPAAPTPTAARPRSKSSAATASAWPSDE